MNRKVLPLTRLADESQRLHLANRRIVATNGCFDILHVGHVRYLARACALGDVLIVGLNGDSSVRQLKGEKRPVNSENDRAEVLAALEAVNYVTIFPDAKATNFLRAARPAIYVKGGDYTTATLDSEERALLHHLGTEIVILPFENGYSTSKLLTRISSSEG